MLSHRQAWKAIQKAWQLTARAEPENARAQARVALEACPEDERVRIQAALVLLDNDDPAAALAVLEGAPEQTRNPAWPVAAALACTDLDDCEKGLALISRALKMEPQNLLVRALRGAVHLRLGQFDTAQRDIAGHVEAAPRVIGRLLLEVERTLNRPEFREDGGTASPAEGAAHEASPALGAAHEASPAEGAAHEASPAEGAAHEASPALGAAHEASLAEGAAPLPWDASPHRKGVADQVVGSLCDPLMALYLMWRARRCLEAERAERAVQYAREAVHRYPGIPRGFWMLGVALLESGRPADALTCLTEAARSDGETPEVLYTQGRCYHELGLRETARSRLNRMLASFEKDAYACYLLGQIDLEEGNPNAARAQFEQAAFLDFQVAHDRIKTLASLLKNRPTPAQLNAQEQVAVSTR